MTGQLLVPAGFTPSRRSSSLLDLVGPIFESGSGAEYRIGLRVDERHRYSRGFCHGAILGLLSDVFLGRICAMSTQPRLSLVTGGLGLSHFVDAESRRLAEIRRSGGSGWSLPRTRFAFGFESTRHTLANCHRFAADSAAGIELISIVAKGCGISDLAARVRLLKLALAAESRAGE